MWMQWKPTGRLKAYVGWFGLMAGGHLALSLHSMKRRVNSCSNCGCDGSTISIECGIIVMVRESVSW